MNPGDFVNWWSDATGYRTGKFIRIVERGRKFGLVQIEPTDAVPRKTVYIQPEHVEPIKTMNTSLGPRVQLPLPF